MKTSLLVLIFSWDLLKKKEKPCNNGKPPLILECQYKDQRKAHTVLYLALQFNRHCPSALLGLATCKNCIFAPVLTSTEVWFNSHPTTQNFSGYKCLLKDESLPYLAMHHSPFYAGCSPSCHSSFLFKASNSNLIFAAKWISGTYFYGFHES